MQQRLVVTRHGLLGACGALVLFGTMAIAAVDPVSASPVQVSTFGSPTSYVLTHDLFPKSLNDLLPGGTTSHQFIYPTTRYCKNGEYFNADEPVPYGSVHAKKYLHTEDYDSTTDIRGCVAFIQSTLPPYPEVIDTATFTTHGTPTFGTSSPWFDYYAYALDAVAPLVGKNSGGNREEPATLSLTAMKNIYRCKAGYTNWKTATGGATAPIVRFWPQALSDTRAFFTDMLGFTPMRTHVETPTSTCTTRPITLWTVNGSDIGNVENTEDGIIYQASITSSTPVADAISIYSTAQFEQQWNTEALFGKSKRNSISGSVIGNFNASTLSLAMIENRQTEDNTAPFDIYTPQSGTFNATSNRGTFAANTSVIDESNEWYSHMPSSVAVPASSTSAVPGIRYVYNVTDRNLPTYIGAKMMIGFDNQATGSKSVLCSGYDSTTISAAGFVPLNSGGSAPATSDANGAKCREFQGAAYPGKSGGAFYWAANTWVQPTT
ncbi:MAG: hypothetical protein ACRDZR_08390 [Acidimicrobiales bacterium]